MSKRVSQRIPLQGQVCLVTGATSGIGRATAAALAARGAQVVVVGRNGEKTRRVVQDMRSSAGNDAIDFLLADFADLDQVRDLAAVFQAQYGRLDVLVNNAGSFFYARQETPYGVEKTFLVNHLAPFLLTKLLQEVLLDSTPARIVNVSSAAHEYVDMDFDDLCLRQRYSGFKAYARSKLANILFTYELARRLADTGVSANALHPGHVATNIWRTNLPFVDPGLKWLLGLFALPPEEGADNSVYLASSPDVEGITGKYFVKREAVPSSLLSYDTQVAKRLWQVSEQLTS
jgi:NAD(P)-dependent dehydrogenase (short-subunit alcohol dehydrogenase family)